MDGYAFKGLQAGPAAGMGKATAGTSILTLAATSPGTSPAQVGAGKVIVDGEAVVPPRSHA